MSRLGWADLGMATMNDMVDNVSMIASLNPSVPVIADADTGYGGPIMVSRTVTQYARAGVAALHIEDQVQEKRCGHLLGKQIVDRDIFYSRIRSAVATRDAIKSDMLIIARTDARQSYGFDEAYERLAEAVRIGADVAFLEALQSQEEMDKVCKLMGKTPVLLNVVPGGVTPALSADEAKKTGFRIVIHPGLCIGPIIDSVGREIKHLLSTGKASDPSAAGRAKDAFMMCGLQECMDLDKHAGGNAYKTLDNE